MPLALDNSKSKYTVEINKDSDLLQLASRIGRFGIHPDQWIYLLSNIVKFDRWGDNGSKDIATEMLIEMINTQLDGYVKIIKK